MKNTEYEIRKVNGARPGVVKVKMNVREEPSRLSLRSPLEAANIASQTAEFRPHDRDVSPFLFLRSQLKKKGEEGGGGEETLYNARRIAAEYRLQFSISLG